MSPLRALAITLALFALPPCFMPRLVQWNIGDNIREAAETHIGVIPADNYRITTEGDAFTIAREARYEADTPLITLGEVLSRKKHRGAKNIELTGHFRKVRTKLNKLTGSQSTIGERYELTGPLPEPQAPNPWVGKSLNATSMGSVAVERSPWYPAAVAAAAPFDYIIDPALSTASTPTIVMSSICCIGAIVIEYTWRRSVDP